MRAPPRRPGKAKGGAIRVSGQEGLRVLGDARRGRRRRRRRSIVVRRETIALGAASRLDASGTVGGTVLVGGDFQGARTRNQVLRETVARRRRSTSRRARRSRRGRHLGPAARSRLVGRAHHDSRVRSPRRARPSARRRGVRQGGARLSRHARPALRQRPLRHSLLLDPYDLSDLVGLDAGMSGFDANANNSVLNVNHPDECARNANVTVTTGSGGTQAAPTSPSLHPVTSTSGSTLTLSLPQHAVNANITAGNPGYGNPAIILRSDNTGVGRDCDIRSRREGRREQRSNLVTIYYNPTTTQRDKLTALMQAQHDNNGLICWLIMSFNFIYEL